ncbi:Rieske 2Fe-2S domain-containing protein [Cyanobacterium sp. DS4]|uniref:aromatic ring-hydroxylating dioxygenase subunit alpha n=1 Tax=Cyanobacterium sp. DS4 TaxID=2878255 RepID=UPI002E7FDAD6|nr:Rieske 2Fe-2S domain-containing protein [Cyanobacterium sp. Dongsha4]WVL00656.1 Rieske 2Fe-2S domain-containing protein [Cyanobacterium sp. Dongsha4]
MTIAQHQDKNIKKSLISLPVGGEDPNEFDYKEVWYPVFFVNDLHKDKPSRFTLLDEDLVVWWDKKDQQWRVFQDMCPHRLAPLSTGRINEDGLLECPYHGWTFSGKGDCQSIPQQPEGENRHKSPRACVKSYPSAIEHDMLFVYAGKKENAFFTPMPITQPLTENEEKWTILKTFRDIPYDALTLLENVLDSSHVSYTHHGTVGNRSNAAPVELEVKTADRQGFTGFWAEGPRKGKLGSQSTTFIAPNLMWHDLTSKQLGRTMTVVYVTPISKGKCRVFALFPFQFASKIPQFFIKLTPQWYSHLNQNTILEDDQIFLHYQERYLEKLGGSKKFNQAFYLPTKSDLFVSELRKWVVNYNAYLFPEQEFPETPNHDQLIERYYSHTEQCSSCSGALKNIKKIRFSALIITGIVWSLIPLIFLYIEELTNFIFPLVSVISVINFSLYIYLGKLEKRFYQGEKIPSRNRKS